MSIPQILAGPDQDVGPSRLFCKRRLRVDTGSSSSLIWEAPLPRDPASRPQTQGPGRGQWEHQRRWGHRQGPRPATPWGVRGRGLVPSPSDLPSLHLQTRLSSLGAAALQTPPATPSPWPAPPGYPPPLGPPWCPSSDSVGPARVTQGHGALPSLSPPRLLCRTRQAAPSRLSPGRSPAWPPPVSRPGSHQLWSQARVPAAQEVWGHIDKHPGRQEPPFSFVFLLPPPLFSSLF